MSLNRVYPVFFIPRKYKSYNEFLQRQEPRSLNRCVPFFIAPYKFPPKTARNSDKMF